MANFIQKHASIVRCTNIVTLCRLFVLIYTKVWINLFRANIQNGNKKTHSKKSIQKKRKTVKDT